MVRTRVATQGWLVLLTFVKDHAVNACGIFASWRRARWRRPQPDHGHLAAYAGARRGELLNPRWADVDLDAKKITISGSTAVIGG
jgi:integrase